MTGAIYNPIAVITSRIGHHDSAQQFQALGVDVFLGDAAFVDHRTVKVADATLKFTKAVVATGTRAARPSMDSKQPAI